MRNSRRNCCEHDVFTVCSQKKLWVKRTLTSVSHLDSTASCTCASRSYLYDLCLKKSSSLCSYLYVYLDIRSSAPHWRSRILSLAFAEKNVLQVIRLNHWIAFSCQPWQNLTLFPWGTEVGFPDNCTQLKPLMHSECNKHRGSIIVGGSGINLPELQKLLKSWQRPTTPIWQHKNPFDMANLEDLSDLPSL